MRAYGYLRFSFLGKNDTKMFWRNAKSPERYQSELFATSRLEQRFYLFENFCLPSFQNQTDPDFKLTILVSEKLPDQYHKRLRDLVAGVPQIELLVSPQIPVVNAFGKTIHEHVNVDDQNTVHFRAADDDALPTNFIESIKKTAQHSEPDTIICLPRGMALFETDGIPYMSPEFAILHARGWARVNAPGDERTPYRFSHGNAGNRFVSVLDPRRLGYIATHHGTSDTIDRAKSRMLNWVRHAENNENAPHFETAKAEVNQAFPWIGYDGLKTAILGVPKV